MSITKKALNNTNVIDNGDLNDIKTFGYHYLRDPANGPKKAWWLVEVIPVGYEIYLQRITRMLTPDCSYCRTYYAAGNEWSGWYKIYGQD